AVLSQVHDGKERVVCYGSRSLTKSERKYCVTRKELLSLVYFVKFYRHYLLGKQFKIRTDHNSLRWLMKTKNPEGQMARWIDALSSYQFEVEHRPGRKHSNADALSRIPCRQCSREEELILIRSVTAQISTDNDLLKNEQGKDNDIQTVKTWLDKEQRPPWKEVNKYGAVVKTYWSQFDRLQIENGLVCRKWFEKGKVSRLQLIVPKDMKSKILKFCHDEKSGGHFGIRKTLAKVRNGFYWAGLQKDVRNWVKSCEICCKFKSPQRTKRAPMQLVGAGQPMERIATDILGPLPETENGNKYILVMSDYFTKWVESVAIPDQTAVTVASALVQEVVCRFGTPAYIHSDQGRQFEGAVYQEVFNLLGMKKTRTTPYHPESDGMVERYNKTLAKLLSAFVNEDHTDWDQLLPYVMMAYRSSEHETTGFTPNYMMLGREVSVPIDIQFGSPIERTFASEWVNKLKDRMEWAHELARLNIEGAILRQKRYHDSKLFWDSFEPGDKVFVFFPTTRPGRCRKFRGLWRGPFVIKRKLSDVTYGIKLESGKPEYIAHIDNIKGYETRSDDLNETECEEELREGEEDGETGVVPEDELELMHEDEAILELGRGQRKRKIPSKYSDYIL
ncbi:MAG: RNase H-like domain-containing protein, partial [Candidatus Thiodiazotropha endolucinida]|nr:DDE-type integrase/transposase/recombinase [Candidatus Thiodiazotropha taylori]MCW4263952.1 RNase H-like domain-containing protein [Candidatus Thiodiazotropha endolucinida]